MASPHSIEASTNSSTLAVNSRTAPKRCVNQPVSGSAMALAMPKLVMTQVPCAGLTPRLPAIAGIDTLAIDESSTFMKVASDSASVPSSRVLPSSGGWSAGGPTAATGTAGAAGATCAAGAVDMPPGVAINAPGRRRQPGPRWRR